MEYNGTNKVLNSNPEDLHVYRKKHHNGNTTPAGVEQSMVVLYFYKHLMPPASLLPLTSVYYLPRLFLGKETASLTTGLQPHSMWLKPLTFMKSANRWLKPTAIKQTAKNDFTTGLNILNQTRNTKYSIQSIQY